MARSTVSGILARIGMGKLGRLGLEPPRRYERERPGELVHLDVKSSVASTAEPASGLPVQGLFRLLETNRSDRRAAGAEVRMRRAWDWLRK